MKYDVAKFVEDTMGIELLDYQREHLNKSIKIIREKMIKEVLENNKENGDIDVYT